MLIEYSRSAGKVGHDSRITTSIVTSMDGRWAATGSDDDTIIIWDLHNGFIAQEWLVRTIPDGTGSPALPGGLQSGYSPHLNFLAFSPSSQHLVSMGAMSGVTVWDLHQGARKVVSLGDDDDFEVLRGCAWSPDGSFIVTYSSDNIVRIWECNSLAVTRASWSLSWTLILLTLFSIPLDVSLLP